ncbi:hypothetical protein [Streptomyces tendae]|uniref:hypothetical protein n=1 Tax=Streptomyces tendae TaxID=1932 RepID=UPI003825EC2D
MWCPASLRASARSSSPKGYAAPVSTVKVPSAACSSTAPMVSAVSRVGSPPATIAPCAGRAVDDEGRRRSRGEQAQQAEIPAHLGLLESVPSEAGH